MAKRNWAVLVRYYHVNNRDEGQTYDEFTLVERKPTKEEARNMLDMNAPSLHGYVGLARPSKVIDGEGRNALHPDFGGWDGVLTPFDEMYSETTPEFRVLIDGEDQCDHWSSHHSEKPTAEDVAEFFDPQCHDEGTRFEVQELWMPFGNQTWDTVETYRVCPACREAHTEDEEHNSLYELAVVFLDGERKSYFDCPPDGDTTNLEDQVNWGDVRSATLTCDGTPTDILSWQANDELCWDGANNELTLREFTVEYCDPQHPEWGWETSDSVTRPEDGDWKYVVEACAEGENGLPAKAEFRVVDQFDEVHGSWHWCDACQELYDGKHECPEGEACDD